jgi:dihydropteroate synthase
MIWRCRSVTFDLQERVLVMGVLNLTPDSFSDGGRFMDPAAALDHARAMIDQGADLLDLGAESTRPGAEPVAAREQWRRLEPVLAALAAGTREVLSIDTANAEVAARALEAGAHVINDVSALSDPGMAGAVAAAGAGLVLMHMRGTPATMQQDPLYDDVSREVAAWLTARLERAVGRGIAAESVALDPGIGFGKTTRHNLELIARIGELAALGRPVVLGASRKRFIGELTGAPVGERLWGGLAAQAIAAFSGAQVIRTHDVAATVAALAVARALREAARSEARSATAP